MKPKGFGKDKGKPGTKGATKGSAGGSNGKGKGKNPQAKLKKGAKKVPATATKKKEDDTAQDKSQANEQGKFPDLVSLNKVSQPSSDLEDALDVEFCTTKQFLPFLIRLIGQSVFPYNLL